MAYTTPLIVQKAGLRPSVGTARACQIFDARYQQQTIIKQQNQIVIKKNKKDQPQTSNLIIYLRPK